MRILLFAAAALLAVGPKTYAAEVTFYEDALPILQSHCQGCHHPGEGTPMSLLNYKEVLPWAKAIREAVLLKKMPPWYAEKGVGKKFSNDRSLSQEEIGTLVAWADTGAKKGDLAAAPPPAKFADSWSIGKPDLIVRPPKPYRIPSKGVIEYTYVIVPSGFTEDKWVSKVELKPSKREHVHHLIAWVRPPGSSYFEEYSVGDFFVPSVKIRERRREGEGKFERRQLLASYAPGGIPNRLEAGQARLIPAGSDFIFELHYTANGTAGTDRPQLGLVFSDGPPRQRVFTTAALNSKFVIPPNASNHRVEASLTMSAKAILLDMMPHMHLRGKSFEYRAVYPNGKSELLLRVPKYNFNWQLSYVLEEPLTLPKGTRIECTAYFDNSWSNPHNPDPTQEVRWGDQNWEEMMIGFISLAIDADQNPESVFVSNKPVNKGTPAVTGGNIPAM
ncbi:thiol-disulfide isomerase [Nitrosococcus wardiae]|nr:thiol-disulfide isomerase [Nitrosococcus wardiae]